MSIKNPTGWLVGWVSEWANVVYLASCIGLKNDGSLVQAQKIGQSLTCTYDCSRLFVCLCDLCPVLGTGHSPQTPHSAAKGRTSYRTDTYVRMGTSWTAQTCHSSHPQTNQPTTQEAHLTSIPETIPAEGLHTHTKNSWTSECVNVWQENTAIAKRFQDNGTVRYWLFHLWLERIILNGEEIRHPSVGINARLSTSRSV